MATPEEEWEYWDVKNDELRRTQLETVQKAASNWSTLFGALVGVFGVVSFAGGFTTIDKLESPLDKIALGLTIAAAAFWLFATYLSAQASGDLSPGEVSELDATALQRRSNEAAATAFDRLREAKVVGAFGVVLVLLGSLLVLVADEAEQEKSPPTVVAVVDGSAVCGKLDSGADGTLSVGDVGLGAGVESLTIVTKCP